MNKLKESVPFYYCASSDIVLNTTKNGNITDKAPDQNYSSNDYAPPQKLQHKLILKPLLASLVFQIIDHKNFLTV